MAQFIKPILSFLSSMVAVMTDVIAQVAMTRRMEGENDTDLAMRSLKRLGGAYLVVLAVTGAITLLLVSMLGASGLVGVDWVTMILLLVAVPAVILLLAVSFPLAVALFRTAGIKDARRRYRETSSWVLFTLLAAGFYLIAVPLASQPAKIPIIVASATLVVFLATRTSSVDSMNRLASVVAGTVFAGSTLLLFIPAPTLEWAKIEVERLTLRKPFDPKDGSPRFCVEVTNPNLSRRVPCDLENPGFHPSTGVRLQPLTPELYAQLTATRQARRTSPPEPRTVTAPVLPEGKVWSTMVSVEPGERSSTIHGVGGQWLCWGWPSAPIKVIPNDKREGVTVYPRGDDRAEVVSLPALWTIRMEGLEEPATVEVFRATKPCSDFN